MVANALSLLRNLTPQGRLKLGLAAAGVLVALFLLFKVTGHTSYSQVMAGIEPKKTSDVTAALDERGIPYKLSNGGTALSVPSAKVDDARVALAAKGLDSAGDQPGFELFDKQKLGASDFQQQVTYQRALEGQIAQTIEGIQGVDTAQVQLVLPEDQLFTQEGEQASAAVLLSASADSLAPGAVQGIAKLVAGSVKGLSTKNVTITDSSGTLLWPTGDGGSGASGPTAKLAAQHAYEAALNAQLGALLTGTLGPDKARVQTNVALNTDQVTRDQLKYAKKGTPVKTTKDSETLKGKNTSLANVSGASANVTGYASSGSNGNGTTDYKHTTGTTEYGVDKTVTRTTLAPGSVQRLSVALLLDSSIPKAQVAGIKQSVASAAGLDPKRGDTISVTQLPFSKPVATATKTGPLAHPMDAAKYVVLGAATLLFLFFVWRHLRRREEELIPGDPTWLREISAPVALSELETQTTQALPRGAPTPRDELEKLVDESPEVVAQQVHSWMLDG
ncbi:MAG TPA: flagellar basal-body MS-ring/collar protein FliF [Solirubrobacteraceae bacterium]|nr:flagellar basal-body MS-ring/collar protein FliF [Solirubrobacteraceae bacterium]